MINISKVDGVDGVDFDHFDMATWLEMVKLGAFTPDDGSGYPCITSQRGVMYKVLGYSVWPVNQDLFDGVIWYNK
jgi:hypothetical protein